nr:hypothetical protein [Tanacetum cinerariifolium]
SIYYPKCQILRAGYGTDGKSKKSSHQSKADDTNQEKLNLLHLNLCGPELLVYVQDTCPNAIKPGAKKVVVTPENKVKKVRLNCSTSNCGSMPSGNKKNDRISQTSSRNIKNKVEAQLKNVNKKNRVVEPIRNIDVNQSQLNTNFELICATCCPDCSLVSGLRMFETNDRELLLSHELSKFLGNGYAKVDKIEAQRTKPGTRMKRVQEIKSKGEFIPNLIPLILYPK